MSSDEPVATPGIDHFVVEDPTCPTCGRKIQAGRTWCQYCGILPAEEIDELRETEARDEVFRLRRSRWPFFSSAVVFGVAGFVLLYLAGEARSAWADTRGTAVVGWALIVLGPGRLLLRCLRGRGHVLLEPDRGVTLADGRSFTWNQIDRVEHKFGLLGPTPDMATWSHWIRTITDVGKNAGMNLGKYLLPAVLAVTYTLMIVHVLLVAVLFAFSPWPPRVILQLRKQAAIRLVDIEDAARFARLVEAKLESS